LFSIVFTKIGFVEGKGNSMEIQKYSFMDNTAYNASYYRLKQINFDGESKYSPVILITSDKNQSLTIYPNPVKNNIVVTGDDSLMNEDEIELTIISDSGQSLINEKGTFDQVILQLNQGLDKLTPGTYYFSITTPKQNYIQRMIKL